MINTTNNYTSEDIFKKVEEMHGEGRYVDLLSSKISKFQQDKERLIQLLQARVEDRSIEMQKLYAKFGRSIMNNKDNADFEAANSCRIMEGEQNAYEDCIDLLQTEF